MHLHAATCPTAPDPTSQLRWALGLPRVQQIRDPPSSQGGLWHHHVYHGSRPVGRALERRMSYDSGSCLHAGRALGCHVSCGPVCAMGHRHKEKPSRPACSARPACSQHTRACFQNTECQGHHEPARRAIRQHSQCLQDVRTGSYSTTTVQHRPCWPLVWHRYSARWPDSTVPCYGLSATWRDDKTRRAPHR
jgi:hypothetical protein